MRSTLAALTIMLAGSWFAAPGAFAETLTYKTELSGAHEVPPNATKGTGSVVATIDTATKELSWTVTYTGLTGTAMGAHFHGPAELGKNAGIILPFKGSIDSPIKGTATLTDAQAQDFMAGRWYANIHTKANPGGEIRGQMVKSP